MAGRASASPSAANWRCCWRRDQLSSVHGKAALSRLPALYIRAIEPHVGRLRPPRRILAPHCSRREVQIEDDETRSSGDTVLLIIEDDPHYARIFSAGRDKASKALSRRREPWHHARAQYRPSPFARYFLPDLLGWTSEPTETDRARATSRSDFHGGGTPARSPWRLLLSGQAPRPTAGTASMHQGIHTTRTKRLLIVETMNRATLHRGASGRRRHRDENRSSAARR